MNNPIDPVILTQDLVRIPSESSDQIETPSHCPEAGIVAHLQKVCDAAGLAWQSQEAMSGRQNFLVHLKNPGKPKILIICHMDTVSARSMEEPFAGNIRDGRVYGRGSCDDKGPMAAALATIIDLHRRGVPLAYDLLFAATVDEECSMSGAAQLAEELEGWDLCICLEPTGLRVVNAHKGVYRFRVSVQGKAAHSSAPEKGENAIEAMLPLLSDLKEFGRKLTGDHDSELGRASFAITEIQGGSSPNIIPDQCRAGVDMRILPDMDPIEIRDQIQNVVGKRGTVDEVYQGRGIHTDLDHDLIRRFRNILAADGRDSDPTTAAYATDCSKMAHKGPCIVWGPGSIEQAHKRVEFIDINQLEAANRILRRFLTGN